MYATYYPKNMVMLDYGDFHDAGQNYYRHTWVHFTIFFNVEKKEAKPYACVWHLLNGQLKIVPWKDCYFENIGWRPVIIVEFGRLSIDPNENPELDRVMEYTFELAVWEHLLYHQIVNFNTVDWSPARCLVQDKYFEEEMQKLYVASQLYA